MAAVGNGGVVGAGTAVEPDARQCADVRLQWCVTAAIPIAVPTGGLTQTLVSPRDELTMY